jgi:hypothetical protein
MTRAWIALVAALTTASCASALMKLPSGAGEPALDGAEALTQAVATCRTITPVSAEVAMSGQVGGRRLRGRLVVGLAAPASAYLEAPAPFGAPVFIFAADGDDATLLLPRERRVLEHGRPPAVLEAVAGVPLGPSGLRAAVTGCAERVESTAARRLGELWRVIPGPEELYLRRESATGPWRLVAVVHHDSNGAEWRAEYRDFLNNLPRTIRLASSVARRFDLRLALSQVEINETLGPDTFRVRVPPGTSPMTLEELRDAGPLAEAP